MATYWRQRWWPALAGSLISLLVFGGAVAPTDVRARQEDPAARSVRPTVGERVRIAGAGGVEAAAVSVVRLDDPHDLALAEPGWRYVLAEVVVEYTGDEVVNAESNTFTILDTDGFVYWADDAFLRRLDGQEGGGIAPGQAWGAELLFAMPVEAELAQVRFGLTPLVDLRPARVAYGDAVSIVGPDRVPLATVTVGPPTDPYEVPVEVSHIILEDERYVVFPVEVSATGDRPFALDPADFWVVDQEGGMTREMPRGGYQHAPNSPYLQPDDGLAAGATAAGLIQFLLPDGLAPVKVVYSPISDESDQFVILAETDEPPPVATSAPIWVVTPDAVAPACEGVAEWAEELAGRMVQAGGGIPAGVLEDPASSDPAALRQVAAAFDALAVEQGATVVPPAAAEANGAISATFADMAGWLETMAAAVESGDQGEIDAALSGFDQIGAGLDPILTDLEASCPEIVGLL